jgi:hypothetical protein
MFGSEEYRPYGRTRNVSPGIILVGLGVLFLSLHILAPTGALPALVLGGVFAALGFNGARGFFVPGGILLGLGGGIVAGGILGHLSGAFGGAAVVAGLGGGFFLVYLLDRLCHPYNPAFVWARLPGSILLGIAAMISVFGLTGLAFSTIGFLFQWWPLLLIIGGIWLYVAGRQRRSRGYYE